MNLTEEKIDNMSNKLIEVDGDNYEVTFRQYLSLLDFELKLLERVFEPGLDALEEINNFKRSLINIDTKRFSAFNLSKELEMWNRYIKDLKSTYGETKKVLDIEETVNSIINNLYFLDQKLEKLGNSIIK